MAVKEEGGKISYLDGIVEDISGYREKIMGKIKFQNRALFTISVVIYVTALFIYGVLNYIYHKSEIMASVDAKLYNGAAVLKYVLPDDFHDRAINENAVSVNEDQHISRKLTKLIKDTGYKFAYTIIKIGNDLFFIASDIAADPKNKRGTFYFYPYKEADESFFEAFNRQTPTYKTVTDQWGTFRTVMIPETSPGGVKYLACADYDISYVNGLLQKSLLQSLATVLLFILLAVPIVIIYNRALRNYTISLAESEEKFRNFTEQSLVGIYLIQDGVFRYVNPKFAEIFGCTPEECLDHMSFQNFVHPDDKAAVQEQIRKRTSGETEFAHYTFKGIKKTGDIIDVEIFGTATIFDGKPAVSGTLLDITRRKRAEAAVLESESNLQSVFDAVPVGICFMKDRVYRRANQNWCVSFGYAEADLLGKTTDFLYESKEESDRVGKKLNEHMQEHGIVTINTRLKRSDGEFRDVVLTAKPLNDQDIGAGTVVVVHDVTELKRIEAERKGLEDQLRQSQKLEAIGTLAGGIAHDFNNILGGIIGYSELAKMKALEGGDVMGDLNQIIKAGNRAAKLVEHILTVSRRHKQEQRPVRIKTIVEEALKLIRSTLPTTIEIRARLAMGGGIVHADPTQMHQVVMNLCTNAGHAMQAEGGVLMVELVNVELDDTEAAKYLDLSAGPFLRMTVSDTGRGMGHETMERIFDPYFTTKDTGEGTGLGLSVVQGIVKAHGGTITVYSQPGEGTTFHVYLPVILEEEREEDRSEEPLPTGSERILLVDDEQALVDVGEQMLGWLGYQVVATRSSIEALELFRGEPERYDLVITDMTMPHMTGDKLALELMKIRPDIPIILCTGHSKLISKEEAGRLGIRAFVIKPLLKRVMAETVRNVLDKK